MMFTVNISEGLRPFFFRALVFAGPIVNFIAKTNLL
jgi:hypothetical protein